MLEESVVGISVSFIKKIINKYKTTIKNIYI